MKQETQMSHLEAPAPTLAEDSGAEEWEYFAHAAMSDGAVLRQYEDEGSQYNDASPMKRSGTKMRRRIEISTVLPLPNSESTYQVRYLAVEDALGSQLAPVERPFVATVRFRYSDRPLSNEDRILNPLNFRATAYRKDQEVGVSTSSNKGANS